MGTLRTYNYAVDLGEKMAEALGYDPNTIFRVIVDCKAGELPLVYVETYATDKMLDLDWGKGLKGAAIEVLDATEEYKAQKNGRRV